MRLISHVCLNLRRRPALFISISPPSSAAPLLQSMRAMTPVHSGILAASHGCVIAPLPCVSVARTRHAPRPYQTLAFSTPLGNPCLRSRRLRRRFIRSHFRPRCASRLLFFNPTRASRSQVLHPYRWTSILATTTTTAQHLQLSAWTARSPHLPRRKKRLALPRKVSWALPRPLRRTARRTCSAHLIESPTHPCSPPWSLPHARLPTSPGTKVHLITSPGNSLS